MSAGPALPRGPRSVFAKLVAIMVIMAVALLAAVSLFFWQVEAVETEIYLLEAATKNNDAWIENDLRNLDRRTIP
jgi:uncharacterized protein YpmB